MVMAKAVRSYSTAQKLLVQAMIGRMCFDGRWARTLFDHSTRAGAAIDRFVEASRLALSRDEIDEVKGLVLRYTGATGRGAKKVARPDSGDTGCDSEVLEALFNAIRLAKCPRWPCPDVS
jgi:hypothetical protein